MSSLDGGFGGMKLSEGKRLETYVVLWGVGETIRFVQKPGKISFSSLSNIYHGFF